MATKKPSIQPRATKASMLRLQKQQGSGLVTTASAPPPEEPVIKKATRSNAATPKSTSHGSASDGVKAFMAQQRARITKKPSMDAPAEESFPRKSTNVMTGAQRYGTSKEEPKTISNTRNIQVLIKQAKAQGKLNISSRGLTKIPEEVLKMYHVDPNSIVVDFTSGGDAWYDAVELTKFVAGDNAITEIDDKLGEEFGALTQIDFRDNKISSLPDSLKLLRNLTSILMPYNSFQVFPDVVFELQQLKELDLSHNHIKKDVVVRQNSIELLNISHNEIKSFILADDTVNLTSLRKLNLSSNQIEELPASITNWTKLTELLVNQNKLRYLFSSDIDATLPVLVRLDASNNLLSTLQKHEIAMISMPKLVELSLLNNKFTEEGLLGLCGTPNIQTLDISSNQLAHIPASVIGLDHLQRLDVRGNQLHALSYELGKLSELKVVQCEGNPMRSFASMGQVQLIESLRAGYQQQLEEGNHHTEVESVEEVADLATNFTQKVNLTMKLDLSKQKLTELTKESMKFTQDIPGIILLNNNEFTISPTAQLSMISEFIVHLHLDHNKLSSFDFTMDVVFPVCKTLKLNNNRIKSLICNNNNNSTISFPKLEELVLNHNLLTTLPENLPTALPSLKTLALSSNKLDQITADSFGLKLEILDLSNNDIGSLPPGLSNLTELKELTVYGNRFRVPRPNIVEQGTKAILEFLKRRNNPSSIE